MEEGKTGQGADCEKQREVEEWRMRCRVSREREKGDGGMEGQSSVCVRVIFQGRDIFPETLEEKTFLRGDFFEMTARIELH